MMKKHLFVLGAAALVFSVFTSGCGWFESSSADDKSENSFYRPLNKQGANAKGGKNAGGDADFMDPNSAANKPSGFGSGSGLDANTYDGFGTRIEGVSFDPVYFDFDQSRVSSSEMAKIDKVVAWLNKNPGCGVVVEGNCDNRGSEEYNRALGERRAIASQEQILAAGVAANRVKTISNGKSKPAMAGENESSWRLNRRDDFVAVKLFHP